MGYRILFYGLLVLLLLSCAGVYAEEYACDSCLDCSQKLKQASNLDVITLSADIIDHNGTCINWSYEWGDNRSYNITFNCQGYTIDGVSGSDLTDRDNSGILLESVSVANVRNCTVTDYDYGIYSSLSSQLNVTGNVLAGNNNSGLYMLAAYYSNISNNTMTGNGEFGAFMYYGYYNTITGNRFTGSGDPAFVNNGCGLLLRGSSYNNVSLNHFEENTKFSLITDGTIYCGNNVSENTVGDSSKTHLYVRNRRGMYLGNTDEYGEIYLCNVSDSVVENVTLRDLYGISLMLSSNVTISESSITNVPYGVGIHFSENNTMSGNYFASNLRGVYIEGTSYYIDSSGNMVVDNVFEDNNVSVFILRSAHDNTAENNTVNSGETGIKLGGTISNTIKTNTITGTVQGISIDGYQGTYFYENSTGNELTGNIVCSGTGSYDIYQYLQGNSTGGSNTCDRSYNWQAAGEGVCEMQCVYATSTTSSTSSTTSTMSTTSTTMEGTVTGDIDGDSHVDFNDLVILAAAYDTNTGDGNFDARADLTGDGYVGFEDLLQVAENYGV